ncbi:MAG: CAP domain-containing protein [Candidatus Peregrinibacteria bacterium]|nr:CAP domain-containing protein [Candidatus Peregrinibacteria bacterium]
MKRTSLWMTFAVLLVLVLEMTIPASAATSGVLPSSPSTVLVAALWFPDFPSFPWKSSSSKSSSSASSTSSVQSSSKSSSIASSSSSTSQSVASQSSSSVDISLVAIRKRILELVNEERKKAGVVPLSEESHLTQAAQAHAEDMWKRNYFSHINPEGKGSTDRIRAAGYPLTGRWYTGENIAKGQTTAEQVMTSWLQSLGHRSNILNRNFRDIGIGYYDKHWVQDFGAHNL